MILILVAVYAAVASGLFVSLLEGSWTLREFGVIRESEFRRDVLKAVGFGLFWPIGLLVRIVMGIVEWTKGLRDE